MKLLHSLDAYPSHKPAAVTIGSFDGVHLGHHKVLNDLKSIAKKNGEQSVVISFEPHPRMFFKPDSEMKLLTTTPEKIDLLDKQGIDYLILQKFDENFANQSPETYIKNLVEKPHMKNLLIGYDHRFGKNRAGNFEMIQSMEDKFGYKTHKIAPLLIENEEVSSTKIRQALQEGNIDKANKFLGYPYFIEGRVVAGNQLGRELGFPTANIDFDFSKKILPKQGVFVVKSIIDNQPVYGMMNLGLRPTINGQKLIMEVHFFDFDKDIYGHNIQVSFLKRLRDEQKFDSLDALKQQLKTDAKASKGFLDSLGNDFLSVGR